MGIIGFQALGNTQTVTNLYNWHVDLSSQKINLYYNPVAAGGSVNAYLLYKKIKS